MGEGAICAPSLNSTLKDKSVSTILTLIVASWHGVGFWLYPGMSPETDLEVPSDAAGAIGFGAYSQGQRCYSAWSTLQARQSIAYQELFPVVIAAHLWGSLGITKMELTVYFHLTAAFESCEPLIVRKKEEWTYADHSKCLTLIDQSARELYKLCYFT